MTPQASGPKCWEDRATWGRSAGLVLALIALAVLAGPARGDETDPLRVYGTLRLGVAVLTDRHLAAAELDARQQLTGLSVGVDLGRHLSLELAGDVFETDLRGTRGGKLGELGLLSLVPQVRLRQPLLGGRLSPYLVGGVGLLHGEFNDRKAGGIGTHIRGDDTSLAATVGAGVEWFVADNVALGVEARYLIARNYDIEVGGRRDKATLDGVLAAASLRLLFPETGAGPRARPEPVPAGWGAYVAFRAGGAVAAPRSMGAGFESRPENAAILGEASQVYGAAVGVDIGSLLGVELAVSGWEGNVWLRGVGLVEEYAVYSLVPYDLAGAGVGWHETNDGKPAHLALDVTGKDWGFVATGGAGLDWFIASNIAVGVETAYYLSRGHQIAIQGHGHDVHLGWVATTLGVRIYFAGTGRR